MFERKLLNQRDALTGAWMRQALPTLWKMCRRVGDGRVAICFLDIDYFKSINDAFGHSIGDAVLRFVASVILSEVRQQDILVRYAGDEFLLLMPGVSPVEAHSVAERLLSVLQRSPFVADGHEIPLTLSIGVATFPEDGFERDQVVQAADKRAYQAKQAGRACVVSQLERPSFWQALESAWTEANQEAISRFHAWLLHEWTQSFCIEGIAQSGVRWLALLCARLATQEGWRVVSARALHAARNRHYALLFQLLEHAAQPQIFRLSDLLTWVDTQETPLLFLVEDAEYMDEASALRLQSLLERVSPSHLRLLMASTPVRAHEHTSTRFPAAVTVRTRVLDEPTVKGLLLAEFGDVIERWHTHIYHRTQGAVENVKTFVQRLRAGNTRTDLRAAKNDLRITDHTVQRVLEEWAYHGQLSLFPDQLHGQHQYTEAFIAHNAFRELAFLVGVHNRIVVSGIKGVGKTMLLMQVAREYAEQQDIPRLELTLPSSGASSLWQAVVQQQYAASRQQQFWHSWPADLSAFDGIVIVPNWNGPVSEGVALLNWLERTFPHAIILVEMGHILFAPGIWHQFVVKPLEPDDGVRFFEQVSQIPLSTHERRLLREALQSTYVIPDLLKLGVKYVQQENLMAFIDILQARSAARRQETPEQDILKRIAETNLYYWQHMLNEHERDMTKGLGVFEGAFSAQEAEAIVGVSPFWLHTLLARGVVYYIEPGYFMLNRGLYAAIQEEMSVEQDEGYRRRHAEFFLRLVEQNVSPAGRVQRWLSEHAISNLVAAWEWAYTQGETDLWNRMLYPVLAYTLSAARFDVLQRLLVHSVEAALAGRFSPIARATLFCFKGALEQRLGHNEQSFFFLEQAEQTLHPFLARTADEFATKKRLQFTIDLERVFCLMVKGLFEESKRLAQRLLNTAYAASHIEARVCLMTALSGIRFLKQDFEGAERYLRQILALIEQHGIENDYQRALTLNNLASALYHQGKLEEALPIMQEVLAYCEQNHNKRAAAAALDTLADIYYLAGDFAQAAFTWYRSLTFANDSCAWSVRNEILAGVVRLLAESGERQLAEHLAQALANDPRSFYLVHSRIESVLANAAPSEMAPPAVEDLFDDVLQALWTSAHT